MRQTWYLHLCSLGDAGINAGLISSTGLAQLQSTLVEEGEKKERPILVALCSPLVSWVVRRVARQRNRHRRDQHKPPVRVCNVGIEAPSEMRLNVRSTKMSACAFILFKTHSMYAGHLCPRSHKCALRVTPPRDSYTWILQRISAETFRTFNSFLCNQINSVSPLQLDLKPSRSFLFHVIPTRVSHMSLLGVALSHERRCKWSTP